MFDYVGIKVRDLQARAAFNAAALKPLGHELGYSDKDTASWLNQIEIYFSIILRKVLTPNDFPCLEAVAERLANFERHFESIAHPFEWKFTRADLNTLIARMRERWAWSQPLKLAA